MIEAWEALQVLGIELEKLLEQLMLLILDLEQVIKENEEEK